MITPVALLSGWVVTISLHRPTRLKRTSVGQPEHLYSSRVAVGDVSTVNGGIRLSEAAIAGEVHTVNGSIELGARARVDSAETVNGGIGIGEEVIATALSQPLTEI